MSALRTFLVTAILTFGMGSRVWAGSATNIYGLYYTGVNSGFGLLSSGSTDSNWTVTYASTNGGNSANTTYQGSAYVVGNSYIDAGWVQNTASAQWVVPPGAMTAITGGTVNASGDYLPGNGNTGSNEAIYVYTLKFTITGTGTVGSAVTNAISISLTIAADDQYQVYVNPTTYASGKVNTGASTLAGSATSAWTNTNSLTLTNTGAGANANFVIGTNYITIVVDNTNSITGASGSTALNPSGLLVYEVGGAVTIDGKVIPEVGTWLPLVGALGLFVWTRRRRLIPAAVPLA